MNLYIYSRWDGSEPFGLNEDELLEELERNLMAYGDLSHALWRMQREGITSKKGLRLPSMQELLQQLRQRRQSQLDKYKLSSVMDEIRQKLDNILKTEREGIQKRLDEARQETEEGSGKLSPEMQKKLLKMVEDRAAQNLEKLDNLPSDVGGQIRELSQYDFMDEEARRQFQELMEMLKKHALESYARDLAQKLKDIDANTIASVRNLVEAINQILEDRLRGEEPDFNSFMEQFGHYFGPQPPQSLDELIEQLQNQMAQAQSLLDSLSPEDRSELEELLQSALDKGTQYELAKLASNLESLYPVDSLRRQYPFSGEESISYTEALKLMEMLQKIDKLEAQLKDAQYHRSLDTVDKQLVKELMGDEAGEQLEAIRNITRILEEAGYIRRKDGKYELTPRGMRKIGQKALKDVFTQLRKDRAGGHAINLKGVGGERTDEVKKYEFGDTFWLHLERTIMNALYREPQAPPVKLSAEDLEVFKTEELTRSATVLMLDLSLSMPMRGNFQAAKQVTIALDALIRSRYPKDSLYIVGFSSYARELKKEDLAYIGWDDFDPYTNMQHGFALAGKLLAKEKCTNKQIILISDGEPTAHVEQGNIYFQYPPSPRTLQLTLREVRSCTRKGIVINTFMLEGGAFLNAFVTQMARINKGRVFFTSPDRLGQYLLVDYISGKRQRISR